MLVRALALLASLLAPGPVAPHPNSLSSSRIVVEGREARLTLRCQVLSLLEVIEGLDADGSGAVTARELEQRRADVLAYLGAHYELWVGTDRGLGGGRRLVPEPVALAHLQAGVVPGIAWEPGGVDAELVFRSAEAIRDLKLCSTLFAETSPDHIDIATIDWGDAGTRTFALEPRAPCARSDPSGRGALALFVGLGFRHILGGWDHLCFVLVLILASRRVHALLVVVTAFTLAHSVTLALAALDVVDLGRWSSLVEAAIALSIAYVAVDNLVHPHLRRARWPEAFGFGLVHGLGFAGFLAESLVNEEAVYTALFGFNLGVELGQVLVVLVVVASLRLLPRGAEAPVPGSAEPDPFLAPGWLRRAGSAVVAVLGLWWFFERAW